MHGPLPDLLILLAIGLPLVLAARRLGVSALVAYLIVGAIAGSLHLADLESVKIVGEVGASLLLFGLGLEMDVPAMRKHLRPILISAVMQIGATLVVGALVMHLLGQPWTVAIATGCCLSISSTLMVLRALDERHLRSKLEGRRVIGLLLTQDFAIAPLLLIITLLQENTDGAASPLQMAIGLVLVIGATVLLRRVVASTIFHKIRAAQVPELEVAFSVTVALGSAVLAEHLGLGAAVGAFCAGLALGGDEYSHAIENSTRPLMGLLAIIFFTSIGMQFDVLFVIDNIALVIGALLISGLIKAALAGAALHLAGLPLRSALGCGIMVGQIGEFSFVLAANAYNNGSMDQELYKLIVAVACLSLLMTPFMIRFAVPLLPRSRLHDVTRKGDHIVVAGLGPVGNTVVETLLRNEQPLFLVDRNPNLLRAWEDTPGVICYQGHIEEMEDWLPQLGERPKAVFLTFPIVDTSAMVAKMLLSVDPLLTIIARSPFESQIDTLRQTGIRYVICDETATADALLPLLDKALSDDRRHTEVFQSV